MSESASTSHRIHLSLALVSLLLAGSLPVAAGEPTQSDGALLPIDPEFFVPGPLPAEDRTPEERIEAYLAVLGRMVADPEAGPSLRPSFDFGSVVADLSIFWEPADAVGAAQDLTGETGSSQLYEDLGLTLLSAARLARFEEDLERAEGHLAAASHVFELADRMAKDEPTEMGLLHRAMVHLEEILVTESEVPRAEAEELLYAQLRRTPEGPAASWAWRILQDPDEYVADTEEPHQSKRFVGGDVRPPKKIFAPRPRYTKVARKVGLQGVAILQAIIDRHGTLTQIRVLKGLPMGLTEEAVRTLATWHFEPATLNGEAVSVHYNLTMNFRLGRQGPLRQTPHPK